jgi:hypothetical protein
MNEVNQLRCIDINIKFIDNCLIVSPNTHHDRVFIAHMLKRKCASLRVAIKLNREMILRKHC